MLRFAGVRESDVSAERATKPWRVLHACETVAAAAVLAEAESSVGMNPEVLSREFWKANEPPTQLSLMNAWHDVRDWRHALNEAEALTSVQIVHAHSFASAMAGVRGSLPLVYDFATTLDELASHQDVGTWLTRSFRVAEQFALSRASAVVAHCTQMKKTAGERGAASEHTFQVPEPISVTSLIPDRAWAADHSIDLRYDRVLFALPDPTGVEHLLRAFAIMSTEWERAVLVFEADNPDREQLIRLARELEIADSIRCVTSAERELAVACADVVIAPATDDHCGRSNSAMLMAMACGRAVVAADVPENRECTADGRGCVWFRSGDITDLAHRAVFVARNQDFSRALGENGRTHIQLTRAPQVAARQYDEIYRHAQARRSDNLPRISVPKIYAIDATI